MAEDREGAMSTPEQPCSGRCVLFRDRGLIDPYNVAYGDQVLELDPDCPKHGRPAWDTAEDVPGRGWHYLLHLTNGDVVKCPGNQEVAERHLKKLREQHTTKHVERFGRKPDTVPYLIGVYPPNAIGGPGSTPRAFGFSPTLYGDIHTDPDDWIRA